MTTPDELDGYEPEDFADFEAAEDRDDLADMPLDMEPCEECGGELRLRGAFPDRALFDCAVCGARVTVEFELEESGAWDDEEEEDEEEQ